MTRTNNSRYFRTEVQRVPTRYVIASMTFMSSMFAYIVRASFSLNLLAMVNVYDANGTLLVQPDVTNS